MRRAVQGRLDHYGKNDMKLFFLIGSEAVQVAIFPKDRPGQSPGEANSVVVVWRLPRVVARPTLLYSAPAPQVKMASSKPLTQLSFIY